MAQGPDLLTTVPALSILVRSDPALKCVTDLGTDHKASRMVINKAFRKPGFGKDDHDPVIARLREALKAIDDRPGKKQLLRTDVDAITGDYFDDRADDPVSIEQRASRVAIKHNGDV